MSNLQALKNSPFTTVDSHPTDIAERSYSRGQLLDSAKRSRALDELCAHTQLAGTETGRMLEEVLAASDRAVDVLSVIGYIPLRHLRAKGRSLSQIAKDLGLNVHDLTAFMSQAPTAMEDAELDAEAFADTKASELLETIEDLITGVFNSTPAKPFQLNRDKVELMKIRAQFLTDYNKRLSHKWAQRPQTTSSALPQLVINIGTNAVPKEAPQPRTASVGDIVSEQAPVDGTSWLVDPAGLTGDDDR